LKEELQRKDGTIEVPDDCEIDIIAFQFRQLLFNLISNALKFSKADEPPRIIISCKVVEGSSSLHESLVEGLPYCHMSIADNGIGFEPEYKEKIFELFQRLQHITAVEGTGIGLAIV